MIIPNKTRWDVNAQILNWISSTQNSVIHTIIKLNNISFSGNRNNLTFGWVVMKVPHLTPVVKRINDLHYCMFLPKLPPQNEWRWLIIKRAKYEVGHIISHLEDWNGLLTFVNFHMAANIVKWLTLQVKWVSFDSGSETYIPSSDHCLWFYTSDIIRVIIREIHDSINFATIVFINLFFFSISYHH